MKLASLLAGVVAVLAAQAAQAETVTLKGVHLCCAACVRDANSALEEVKGISDIAIDRNSKQITFQAESEEAANAGVKALTRYGFGGAPSYGDKALTLPDTGAKPGVKADAVVLNGVHLCCGGCVKGAQEAVANVKGVETIDIDREAETVTLKGAGIDVTEAVNALIKGGFYATVE